MKKVTVFCLLLILLPSCEVVQTLMRSSIPSVATVTPAEQAAGLKEALTLGITNTVEAVSRENGYFSDALLRLSLPPETRLLTDNIRLIPGGSTLVDNVILRLNRAAEDAAAEALPIFVQSIKDLTLADAGSILFGADTAATAYLRKSAYARLKTAFIPKVEASLNKDLVAGVSATESWTTLTTSYNQVAQSLAGKALGLKPVQSNLTSYVTDRALQGLFLKTGETEQDIRKRTSARVTPLLQKVFGLLDR